MQSAFIVMASIAVTQVACAAWITNGDFESATTTQRLTDSGFDPIFVEWPAHWASDPNFRNPNKGWPGEVVTPATLPVGYVFPYDLAEDDHFLLFSSPQERHVSSETNGNLNMSTVSLYQEIDTIPGTVYLLGFDFAATTTSILAVPEATLGIAVAGAGEETFTWSQDAFGWAFLRSELVFTASLAKTRITFSDLTVWPSSQPVAAMVDNIRVDVLVAVPEPSTTPLLCGLLIVATRRRRGKN